MRQFAGNMLEHRCIFHIFIVNAMNSRRFFGDMHSRIHPDGLLFLLTVRIHFQYRNFHDPVFSNIDSRGFQIEKNDGLAKFSFIYFKIYNLFRSRTRTSNTFLPINHKTVRFTIKTNQTTLYLSFLPLLFYRISLSVTPSSASAASTNLHRCPRFQTAGTIPDESDRITPAPHFQIRY